MHQTVCQYQSDRTPHETEVEGKRMKHRIPSYHHVRVNLPLNTIHPLHNPCILLDPYPTLARSPTEFTAAVDLHFVQASPHSSETGFKEASRQLATDVAGNTALKARRNTARYLAATARNWVLANSGPGRI